jgi:hypothetical protein
VGAERLCSILSQHAKEGRELNIWRQFGEAPAPCMHLFLTARSLCPSSIKSVHCSWTQTDRVCVHRLSLLAAHGRCLLSAAGHMTMDVVGSAAFGCASCVNPAARPPVFAMSTQWHAVLCNSNSDLQPMHDVPSNHEAVNALPSAKNGWPLICA